MLSSPLGSLTLALAAAAYGSVVQILFKAFATALVAFVQTGSWPYASGAEAALQNACAISSATGQIGFLNIAIGESPVTYAVPAYQSALLLGTLVLAGAVLGEFDALPHHALIASAAAAPAPSSASPATRSRSAVRGRARAPTRKKRRPSSSRPPPRGCGAELTCETPRAHFFIKYSRPRTVLYF